MDNHRHLPNQNILNLPIKTNEKAPLNTNINYRSIDLDKDLQGKC